MFRKVLCDETQFAAEDASVSATWTLPDGSRKSVEDVISGIGRLPF